MAECEWVILCRQASFDSKGNMLSLVDIITEIHAQSFPIQPVLTVGVRIIGEPGEKIEIDIEIPEVTGVKSFGTISDRGLLVNALPLPTKATIYRPGLYHVQCVLGGELAKSVSFLVR